jgi:4-hydroxybenzoate polyprenyltransferase
MTTIWMAASRGPRIRTARHGFAVGALCISEARPWVLAVFAIRFLVSGSLTQGGVRPPAAHSLLAALAWEAAIFAIYLFNGVMDIEEDRVNGSRRPIARGALQADVAARVAACAGAASLMGSLALGPALACPVAAVLAIGFLYSGPPCFLKRRAFGTAAVGVSLGLLTYWAGLSAAGATPGTTWLVFVAGMSAWMGLVGVPAKDLSDIEGDRAAGRRSLPVIIGELGARVVICAAAVGVGAAFGTAWLLLSPPLLTPAAVLGGGAAAVTGVTASRLSHGDRGKRRLPYRMFMLTQLLVNMSLLAPLGALSRTPRRTEARPGRHGPDPSQ